MAELFGRGAMKNLSLRPVVVVTATVLGVLTALLIGGILTPRSFGLVGLASLVACGSALSLAIKNASPRDESILQRRSTTFRDKGFYLRIAAFLIVLAFAVWATRGGPWLPRLIGASMLLLFLIGTLYSRR
jgi:hypothetical protein